MPQLRRRSTGRTAHCLDLAGHPPPCAPVLAREIYHGVIVWNMSRKPNDLGQVDQKVRPSDECVRTAAELLRILPEELWERVTSRRQDLEGRAGRFESGLRTPNRDRRAQPAGGLGHVRN
jgi:hypothetical protein